MNIGIVCPYDITRSGGVQEHVLAQAAELRRRGHRVKILTPRPRKHSQDPPADVIFVGNSAKVKTPIKTSLELGVSLHRDEVDDILATEAFDLLHIHEPEVPMVASQILAKANCPVVATFHALSPDTPMGRALENLRVPFSRSIFSKLSAMTAVSEAAAQFVRERVPKPVAIIPNGIDLTKYTFQTKRSADHRNILYIGRLEKRKGVIYLLKAFAELASSQPDLELIIAGDGEQRESLERYVRDHRLAGVRFLGFVDEAQKQRLLHEAALFCSPALYGESFGIVLLEAMASGTVVVAGNNPGYSGVLQGVGSQSLVDPQDTAAFASRLELLLQDTEARQDWLEWAENYVPQFAYQKVVDRYEALYEQIIKDSL